MSGFASESAYFRVAKQAAKGSAPTAYTTAMAQQSGINSRRDEINQTPEHGIGADRATEHKSATQYGSYVVTGSMQQAAYTTTLGLLLLGAGFKVTTTGAGTAKTHTFKLADRNQLSWLAILSKIGSVTRRAVDCRVSKLTIEAGLDTMRYSADFMGITLDDPTGSETFTSEDLTKLSPAIGSLTLNIGGTEIFNTTADTLQRFTMEINNPLDDGDRSLFRFKRADLQQSGLGITGTIEGLDLDYADIYNRLIRGGATSGEPVTDVAVGTLVTQFKSAVNVEGDVVPYSLQATINAEFTLDDFQAEGNNIVRWNTRYRMIDNVTDPVVIALVNAKASY